MKKINLTYFILFVAAIVTSCKEEKCGEEADPNAVTFKLNLKANNENFSYNTNYNIGGTTVSFSDLRFYLSEFELNDGSGNTQTEDQVILVDASHSNNVVVSETNLCSVNQLNFTLGLNAGLNSADPITANPPLNDASMHWGWNPEAGYKFIVTSFSYDSDGDMIPDANGAIHCATNEVSRAVRLETTKDVSEDENTINLSIDVLSFFEGVDFLNLTGTHGGSPLTNTVADNAASSMSIE